MTQGMVTILCGGKVAMKIVVGCDGYNASKVSAEVRAMGRTPTVAEALELSERIGFGCDACRVVVTENEAACRDGDAHQRYRDTFSQPLFNPRWECGLAERLEVVELEADNRGQP
jgi:hypothetical protein